jgi:hypothetical protein
MSGKRSGLISVAVALLLSGTISRAQEVSGPFTESAAAELDAARSPEWVSSFTREIVRLQSKTPLSPDALSLTLGAVPARWLPENPGEAARVVMDASGQTDVALRRGVPRALLREEIRSAWRTYLDSGRRILLRTGRRDDSGPERGGRRMGDSWQTPRGGEPGGWGNRRGMAGGGD